MTVSYLLRLLCLCLASFSLINALLGLTASIASRPAVRIAGTLRPRAAAHFLLVLRLLPFALGLSAVLGLCVPSYLWFEPQATPERVGWVCLTLALFGGVGCFLAVARTVRAAGGSARCYRLWHQAGREARLPGEASKAVIVEREGPLLALAGVFRPRLVVSGSVLRALSSDQLDVALHHENAHRGSRDNLKRLLLLLTPDYLPFLRGFFSLDCAWMKFSEWAADDEATQGDSRRALSLAGALLCVARLGAGPRLSFLHTSLLAGDGELSARIDRLLCLEPAARKPRARAGSLALGAGLGMAACVATLLAWRPIFSSVHRVLELFLR